MQYYSSVIAVVVLSYMLGTPVLALEGVSKDEHREIIAKHLKVWDSDVPESTKINGVIMLDDTGDRAPIERIPGGAALGLAAEYYSIATLDFDVTIQEVIDFGLWPFDTIPHDFDCSLRLHSFPVERAVMNNGDLDVSGEYGSAKWRIVAKQQILHFFYEEYFVRNYRMREIIDGCGTAENWPDEVLEQQREVIITQGYPLNYPLDCIPDFIDCFWTNDIECRNMCINTGLIGDIEQQRLSKILMIENGFNSQLHADIEVSDINLKSK